MMLFSDVLSIATGVGGFWCTISASDVLMEVAFWQFSNNPPNYNSVDDAIAFLIIIHSTCNGPFSGVIACIVVFDLGPRKNIHRLCFMPLVLICRMHLNICVE